MNWVGGSRTRVLIKQERRKQKEYFERNKLKSKMKLLGVFSPVKNPSVSLDLLNLYMVNQISSKKEISETMKRPTHVNMNRDLKIPLRKHNLELPMSPHCVPSKLCIDDVENSVPYQRFYSKEETGPVQSSHDMNSYRMLNETENCSYIPSSFPEELPTNRHILSQRSTPIAPSPRQFAYENPHTGQLSNGQFPESLFSKLNKHQSVFSSSRETAEFGASYERTNSSETGDFLTESQISVMMGDECGILYERRQPDFAVVKTSVPQIGANSGEEFSHFLEDGIHPTQRHLPDHHDSFINHNMINLLSRDQPGRRATFNQCGYDCLSDAHVVSSDESQSTNGFIPRNFTVPRAASPNRPFSASYIETCQSNRPCQKQYTNNERNELRRSLEKDCYPVSCGRRGKIESNNQLKTLQRNSQESPVYTMAEIPLEELHHKQSCDFGQNEMPVERRTGPLKGRPVPAEKIYLESSQSSQSTSYSPRPTDSTFSSSSELLSEDEDQNQQQIEHSNKKATETTDHGGLEKVEGHLGDITVKDNAKVHRENHKSHQSSEKDNSDTFPESQCNSEHTPQNKSTANCVLRAGRCDVGVQTEEAPLVGSRADVAVQCTIIAPCSCKSSPSVDTEEESSLSKAGSCTEDMMSDTTGGQETPTDN
ncbi:regulator of DNA class I crossover intermediates 1 isoform X1 [Rattus norvegicus]|uniref:Regulator of DNA class I crossover intermediates 1 n=1 Tax=Rattus norvegicus TaxID=10116 RepID=F1LTS3_RAT|nr:uncharacterized protein C12orf40 homolog isoform X1 [Rattus norvegicus]|eukprot:XP_006242331.1 PREDICTED: uncharacterized protein C12orf40 homolog isoform X2 [Rattus norvegicus]